MIKQLISMAAALFLLSPAFGQSTPKYLPANGCTTTGGNLQCPQFMGTYDITLPPFNAKCDAHSDDTAVFQNAINTLPAPSVIFIPGGATPTQCEIPGGLTIASGKQIVIQSTQASNTTRGAILDYSGTGTAITASSGSWFGLVNADVEMSAPSRPTGVTPIAVQMHDGWLQNSATYHLVWPAPFYYVGYDIEGGYVIATNAFTDSSWKIFNVTEGSVFQWIAFGYDPVVPVGIDIENSKDVYLYSPQVAAAAGTIDGVSYPGYGIKLANNVGPIYVIGANNVETNPYQDFVYAADGNEEISGSLDFTNTNGVSALWNQIPKGDFTVSTRSGSTVVTTHYNGSLSGVVSGSGGALTGSNVTVDSTGNNQNVPGRASSSYLTTTTFAPSGMVVYGDSISYCFGQGVSSVLNCYWKRLANRLGVSSPNIAIYAASGNEACDVTNGQMFPNDTGPEATANPRLRTMQIGINDVTYGGGGGGGNPGPTSPPFPYLTTFRTCWNAAAAWGTVPPADKVLAASATTTGTCSSDTTYAANPGKKCTVSGSTIRFTFTTPTTGAVYAWVRYIDSDTGTWTYQLDSGTPIAQTTALNPPILTATNFTQGVGLLRIANVAAGTHTLTFTQTANGTMSVLAVGWPPVGPVAQKPWMIVGDMSNELNGANQTAVNAYRSEINADYTTLANDGLNLSLAPVSQHVLATTAAGDMNNTIHPNDVGHQEYYSAFLDPVSARDPFPGMATWQDWDCTGVNGGATITLSANATPTCVIANGPGTVVLPNVGDSPSNYNALSQAMVVTLISLNGSSPITVSGVTGGNAPSTVTGFSVTLINYGGGVWDVVSSTAAPTYSGLAASLNSPLLNTNQTNQASTGLAGAESLYAYGGNDEGRVFGSAFGNYATVDIRPSGWYWAHCFYTGSGAAVTSMSGATANCPWVVGTAGPALKVGTAIASATTIAPASPVVHITGTTAIATITPPTLCTQTAMSCTIVLIPDGAFTTTTAGNIAVASTAVVGRVLQETYDPGTSKWYPSY